MCKSMGYPVFFPSPYLRLPSRLSRRLSLRDVNLTYGLSLPYDHGNKEEQFRQQSKRKIKDGIWGNCKGLDVGDPITGKSKRKPGPFFVGAVAAANGWKMLEGKRERREWRNGTTTLQ